MSHISKKYFKTRDEEEVAGYTDFMNLIFEDYSVIPLSENYIKQLHQILLRYVGKDERHRGKYKKLANSVAAYDLNGKEIGIVFETATPFDTPRLMEELVDWTRKNIDDPLLHQLIVIGVFIVHFLAIHPFQDGNERLSRALTTLLLLKKGYAYVPYSSIESIIKSQQGRILPGAPPNSERHLGQKSELRALAVFLFNDTAKTEKKFRGKNLLNDKR